jgi:5-methylcytosine-specific restriction protein A
MPTRPQVHRPIGSRRARAQQQHQYNASPQRREHQQLYDHAWRRYSKKRLALHPYCVECMKRGVLKRAKVTDHVKDHDGDPVLFRDPSNHQSLCLTCHSIKTRAEHGAKPAPRA